MPQPGSETYAERLTVPLRWWVQATMLLVTVWLAFVVAMPFWAATLATALLVAVTAAMFLWFGAARLAVRDGMLYAGRARIALHHLGPAVPLDADQTRRTLGVEADARAFLLTRPYLKRAVRVGIEDPADRTPYWLLSTRHPDRLVAALASGNGHAGH